MLTTTERLLSAVYVSGWLAAPLLLVTVGADAWGRRRWLAHATWMLAVVVFASTLAWYALRIHGLK